MELWQFWTLIGAIFASTLFAGFSVYAFSSWRLHMKQKRILNSLFSEVIEKVETDIQFRDIVGNITKDGKDND
jgi:hypothetical protein